MCHVVVESRVSSARVVVLPAFPEKTVRRAIDPPGVETGT